MHEISAKIILLDIEGTTTSINFVKNVLFPYAKENSLAYLSKNKSEKNVLDFIQNLLHSKEFEEYMGEDFKANNGEVPSEETVSKFINYLIDKDVKWAPLKTLQGDIWNEGYKSGTLKSHFYADVPNAMKQWKEDGIQIAVYSSGSIKAQKLLFGHSIYGNLLPYITKHFDITSSGYKQDESSYEKITKDFQVDSKDVLFLTDVVKEAIAARSIGMKVVLLNRPGNAPFTDDDKSNFIIINSFEELIVNKE